MKPSRLRTGWGEAGLAERRLAEWGERTIDESRETHGQVPGVWTLIPELWAVLGIGTKLCHQPSSERGQQTTT